MSRFVTHVPLRWTDQDAYRHVNHARVVTLLEEARVELAFTAAGAEGLSGFSTGLLVAGLEVSYRRQIRYRPQPLLVTMDVRDVRAASFTLGYEMHDGPEASDTVAVTAATRMALYDLQADRVRRLNADEREFLARWSDDAAPGSRRAGAESAGAGSTR
ncbi:thioesterase family protein [Pseudonocardia sp. KRD291]|uniref:acyl-CoA thioesterase n=1 Tax=Pseudonocardia sp. KRD291 TaxID=2792007 RepID=UPI001C49EFA8|nr:thioesterase family protein [Pseudonocardia sp. KRD291]MBW0106267.1 thioesterase family protein [Pseudonocardia sp. KRD291]